MGPTGGDTSSLEHEAYIITDILVPSALSRSHGSSFDRSTGNSEDGRNEHQAEEDRVRHLRGLVMDMTRLDDISHRIGSLALLDFPFALPRGDESDQYGQSIDEDGEEGGNSGE